MNKILIFQETDEYYSLEERKIFKTTKLTDCYKCIEYFLTHPRDDSCYFSKQVLFKPGRHHYIFKHESPDYCDIISNIRLNNPNVKMYFTSAGKSYEQSLFLNCCAMYSGLEVDFETDTDVSLEYDCTLLRLELRDFLMYQKIKVGNSIFYNGVTIQL